MKFIGITETYDPCFVPDWETRLLESNIIISKELSDEMIEKLLVTQDRVIFHHTVTGMGGSELEPNVKPVMQEFEQFMKLISSGFDISHYVLRLDPMMPFSPEHMIRIRCVLSIWADYLKKHNEKIRCRVSVVDLYPHAKARIESKLDLKLPWDTFTAPKMVFEHLENVLAGYTDTFNFECCAEQQFTSDFIEHCGCASLKDIEILNKNTDEYGQPKKKQREDCMCIAKKQILGVKPGRCAHQCLYCFWK